MIIGIFVVKSGIAFIVLYLLYRFIFSRLSFFQFNRIYLLLLPLVALLLPIIKFPGKEEAVIALNQGFGIAWDHLPVLIAADPIVETTVQQTLEIKAIGLIYLAVLLFILLRGIVQFVKAQQKYSGGITIYRDGIRLRIHPEVRTPFTMFRTVYLDRHTYEQADSPVIRHEMVHARQLHSVDLLYSEIICAILWFNPFVFLYRRQMRENHEFLADYLAAGERSDLAGYLQILSREISRSSDPAYASYFRSSTFKKRIIMLTNKRSNKAKRCLYIVAMPVIVLLTMAFQQPSAQMNDQVVGPLQVIRSGQEVVPEGPGLVTASPVNKEYMDKVSLNYGWEGKNPVTGKNMKHNGIDYRAPKGTPVYAAAAGKVIRSEKQEKAYGNIIIISHAESYRSLYAHMDELSVKEGDLVDVGEKIGTVGSTGYSTGPHLHFEVKKEGKNIDPGEFLKQ